MSLNVAFLAEFYIVFTPFLYYFPETENREIVLKQFTWKFPLQIEFKLPLFCEIMQIVVKIL